MHSVDTAERPAHIYTSSAERTGDCMAGYFINEVCDTTSSQSSKLYFDELMVAPDYTDGVSMKKDMALNSRKSPAFQMIRQLDDLIEIMESDAESCEFSRWPTKAAFDDARRFILKLPLTRIPMPEIRLAEDGEINFSWNNNGCFVDLGFYGTGAYSYYGHSGRGDEIMDEGNSVAKGLAYPIIKLLSA